MTTNGRELMAPEWDREMVDLIKQTVCKGATDLEFALFVTTCKRTRLDPLARQIYSVRRRVQENGQWREAQVTQVSIDGFRLIADRTGHYGGQLGPFWCGPDGDWKEVWLSDKPPAAARVGVIRLDWKEPLWAVARWESYKQTNRDGDLTAMWKRMPDLMLGKVAESLALRRAFPAELSGLYSADEMAQADHDDAPAVMSVQTVQEPIRPAPPKQLPAAQAREDMQDAVVRQVEANGGLTPEEMTYRGEDDAHTDATLAADLDAAFTAQVAKIAAPIRFPRNAPGMQEFIKLVELGRPHGLGLDADARKHALGGMTVNRYMVSEGWQDDPAALDRVWKLLEQRVLATEAAEVAATE